MARIMMASGRGIIMVVVGDTMVVTEISVIVLVTTEEVLVMAMILGIMAVNGPWSSAVIHRVEMMIALDAVFIRTLRTPNKTINV